MSRENLIPPVDTRPIAFTQQEYQRLYHVELKTIAEIAKLEGCLKGKTRYRMLAVGIKFRTRSEVRNLVTARGLTRKTLPGTPLRSEVTCRGCGAAWKPTGDRISGHCPYCGKYKDFRIRKAEPDLAERKKSLVEWSSSESNRKARASLHRVLLRKRVFFRITGSIQPRCVRCGCDDARLLEINHKNGGGGQETQKGKFTTRFYYDIANGYRRTDDLELLCKACNAIHALEMKYGSLPMKVVWSPQGSS